MENTLENGLGRRSRRAAICEEIQANGGSNNRGCYVKRWGSAEGKCVGKCNI